ncbi:MAG: DUF6580 family putative transport protein [Bacteroidia bacterium]
MKTIIKTRTGVIVAMILTASVFRLIVSGYTPLLGFTPIGAMALFGGCYFSDKWKAYLVPLLTLWLTDLFINYFLYHHFSFFYSGFAWVYGAFALMVMAGTFMKKVNIRNVVLACIVTALLHYIITDFGLWISGTMYPLTWEGFTACYAAALPYLQKMLLSNLVFGGLMFGAFEWAQKRFTVLAA